MVELVATEEAFKIFDQASWTRFFERLCGFDDVVTIEFATSFHSKTVTLRGLQFPVTVLTIVAIIGLPQIGDNFFSNSSSRVTDLKIHKKQFLQQGELVEYVQGQGRFTKWDTFVHQDSGENPESPQIDKSLEAGSSKRRHSKPLLTPSPKKSKTLMTQSPKKQKAKKKPTSHTPKKPKERACNVPLETNTQQDTGIMEENHIADTSLVLCQVEQKDTDMPLAPQTKTERPPDESVVTLFGSEVPIDHTSSISLESQSPVVTEPFKAPEAYCLLVSVIHPICMRECKILKLGGNDGRNMWRQFSHMDGVGRCEDWAFVETNLSISLILE
ncbi:hypothetical protein SUGI_1203180 [Cryptomeria japonica]|nr:hypothetical protein SUGI_1203180 [Cryptomeria japonica]